MRRSTFKEIVEDIFTNATLHNGNITLYNFNGDGWNRTYQFNGGRVEARNWKDNWSDQEPEVFEDDEELFDELYQFRNFAPTQKAMRADRTHDKAKLYSPNSDARPLA